MRDKWKRPERGVKINSVPKVGNQKWEQGEGELERRGSKEN